MMLRLFVICIVAFGSLAFAQLPETPQPPVNCLTQPECDLYIAQRLYDLENRERTNPVWYGSDSGKFVAAIFVFAVGFALGRTTALL